MDRRNDVPASSDLAYSATFAGALGAAAVALVVLFLDIARGTPFFTPSQIGSLLFLGASPSEALPIRLDLVAMFSLVHFVTFTTLGAIATLLFYRTPPERRLPSVALFLFGAQFTGFLVANSAFPGLLPVIGPLAAFGGIVASASIMTGFIHYALGADASLIDELLTQSVMADRS